MKRFILFTVLTAAFLTMSSTLLMAVNEPTSPSKPNATEVNIVGIHDDRFEPRTFNVPLGMNVTWLNYGTQIHTVTSNDGLFDSGDLVPGRGFSKTFTQPGTYRYFCRHHPEMWGVIIVGQ